MPEIEYVWDELSDNVIEEYEDGVLSVSYDHEPGLYGNLLSQNRNGVTSYYHYDGRGDTVALTDDSGNVTDTKEYDAWGNVIASTGTTVTPYQFGGCCGYQSSQALSDLYVRNRRYSPTTARWSACDRFVDATRSPYGFVGNRTLILIDPSGWWEQLLPGSNEFWVAKEGDTFQELVDKINGAYQINLDRQKNIACIEPWSAAWAGAYIGHYWYSDPDSNDWKMKKPTSCAVYNVKNLLPKRATNVFSAAIGTDDNGYISAAGRFFGASHYATDIKLFGAMQTAAGSGCNPITMANFIGHSWRSQNAIGSRSVTTGNDQLNLSDFVKYNHRFVPGLQDHSGYFLWQSELSRAMNCEFSVPCWFAVDSNVNFVGCITNKFATNFANNILRNGGSFARGSDRPTWYMGATMGWGNSDGTAPDPVNPDFQATAEDYLKSKHWIKREGQN